MTIVEAKSEARRRYGESGRIDRIGRLFIVFYGYHIAGCSRDSWEAAFADADRREGR